MGIVPEATVLIAAERAGQNPGNVIEDLLAKLGKYRAHVVEPITVPIAIRAGKIDGSLQSKGLTVALGVLVTGTTGLVV